MTHGSTQYLLKSHDCSNQMAFYFAQNHFSIAIFLKATSHSYFFKSHSPIEQRLEGTYIAHKLS